MGTNFERRNQGLPFPVDTLDGFAHLFLSDITVTVFVEQGEGRMRICRSLEIRNEVFEKDRISSLSAKRT